MKKILVFLTMCFMAIFMASCDTEEAPIDRGKSVGTETKTETETKNYELVFDFTEHLKLYATENYMTLKNEYHVFWQEPYYCVFDLDHKNYYTSEEVMAFVNENNREMIDILDFANICVRYEKYDKYFAIYSIDVQSVNEEQQTVEVYGVFYDYEFNNLDTLWNRITCQFELVENPNE